jgi:hypothetical protein
MLNISPFAVPNTIVGNLVPQISGTFNNAGGALPLGFGSIYQGTGQSVQSFQSAPSPTILPLDENQTPALPTAQHMVAGSPFPHSAQTRLAIWSRITQALPVGVSYNAPKNRMTQV